MDRILTNGRLFTALDNSVVEDATVWIKGNKIVYAGTSSALPEPAKDAIIQDLKGSFVMPGMTETHAHLSFADANPFAIGETMVEDATITAVKNSRLMLASGFTSAISFGSTYQIDIALRAAINNGRLIGPRLLAAGRVDNLAVAVARSQPRIVNARLADGQWAARSFGFGAVDDVLERSDDLSEWQAVWNGVREDGFYLRLIDENPPVGGGFYRLVR